MRTRYAAYLLDGFRAAAQQGKLVTTNLRLPAEVVQRNEMFTGLDLRKHAYGEISAMNNDELKIAQDLARSEQVSWWWRNPDRTGWRIVGYWGRFYPDFIARLVDGRMLVIEYKGKQLAGAEDTERKVNLGQLWTSVAGKGSQFYLVTRDPDAGQPNRISPADLARNVLGLTT